MGMMDLKVLVAGAAVTLMLALSPALAATVTQDTVFDTFTPGAPAARFRAEGNGTQTQLLVGVNDLSVGERVGSVIDYQASQAFSVAYDSITGRITVNYGTLSSSFAATAGAVFNAIVVDIKGPRVQPGGSPNYFSATGLTVNGEAIGNMAGSAVMPRSTLSWLISDILAGPTVTLAGMLNYFGTDGVKTRLEDASLQVRFGNVPVAAVPVAAMSVPAVPLPAGGLMLLTALGGLGIAARRRRAV